ncbi:TPA: hypothetical protein NNP44_004563 [Salmonella enterica]|uniref:Uncharacterized protein n=1 Tax=Acinetobacter phage Ab_SZ3 TaxID=2781361 RepID=A0A873WKN4_9CAUD|nr:hypothetical protein AbSZ3_42 [Acinetobacter phage Ab_SZ3]HCH8285008.1 hypothetical protein [Salmonella enterica]HCH8674061.1 hypothetical protein [Salmonella enterica]HCH8772091.1 hypothetical protein [Salmonella enterica]HCH8780918.1 hypothetical protein [Salmonella enterica]
MTEKKLTLELNERDTMTIAHLLKHQMFMVRLAKTMGVPRPMADEISDDDLTSLQAAVEAAAKNWKKEQSKC